jgi:hypothetical protein
MWSFGRVLCSRRCNTPAYVKTMAYFATLLLSTLYSVKWQDDCGMMNWTTYGKKWSWPNGCTIPAFAWTDWGKITQNLNHYSPFHGRDWNGTPHDCKSEEFQL